MSRGKKGEARLAPVSRWVRKVVSLRMREIRGGVLGGGGGVAALTCARKGAKDGSAATSTSQKRVYALCLRPGGRGKERTLISRARGGDATQNKPARSSASRTWNEVAGSPSLSSISFLGKGGKKGTSHTLSAGWDKRKTAAEVVLTLYGSCGLKKIYQAEVPCG